MKIPRRTTGLFAFMFDPRVPPLFLVGGLVIAVMGNAAFGLLTDVFGKTRAALGLIIAGSLLLIGVVVLSLKAVAAIILSKSAARIGGSQAFSVPRKAIIFTVGNQSDTVELCLRSQNPEFVGFVCTYGSQSYADSITAVLALAPENVEKRIVDPWDIKEVRDAAGHLLTWAKAKSVSPSEIVFDVTGGLTPMSVGAFAVAEENRIDSEYVRSDYDDAGKRLPNTEEAIFISMYVTNPHELRKVGTAE